MTLLETPGQVENPEGPQRVASVRMHNFDYLHLLLIIQSMVRGEDLIYYSYKFFYITAFHTPFARKSSS